MVNDDEYETALIDNETDARLCARLIAEEFALHTAFFVFNHSKPEKLFDTWLWPLMTEILSEKLSFLVRHRSTNEIIAATVAGDLFKYCEKHPYDAAHLASINSRGNIYDEMRNRFVHYDLQKELKSNMVLSIPAVATRSDCSGMGIARKLCARVCDHARDTKGFQYAFVQTIHPATRHIYVNKMGGKETMIVNPGNWFWTTKDNGTSQPYKGYEGEPIVNVLVKLE